MSNSITIEVQSKKDLEKLTYLLSEIWSDFIIGFDVKNATSGKVSAITIWGEPAGLKIVSQNVKSGRWAGKVSHIPAETSKKATTPPVGGKELIIYIGCIEEDWETGIVKFPQKIGSDVDKAIRGLAGSETSGWRITYSKGSVGLVFRIDGESSCKNLREALDDGWNNWKICFDLSMSNIRPDDLIAPDDVAAQYSEVVATADNVLHRNVEEIKGLKFFPRQLESERPKSSVLYDFAGRSEDPWKVVLVEQGGETIIYSAEKKRRASSEVRNLLRKYC